METVNLTTQLAPLFVGLVAAFVLATGALLAMVDQRPLGRVADPRVPERLLLSEMCAVGAGLALLLVVVATLGW